MFKLQPSLITHGLDHPMSSVFDLENDKAGVYTLCDQAARIAINRKCSFSLRHVNILPEYLLRQPIERFKDGVKIEHISELFERCKAKQKDPLLKRLAEADRLFFGINDRKERNAMQARKMYEDLAKELPEARSMCMVIYHAEFCSSKDEKDHDFYHQELAANSLIQLLTKKFTAIGLCCLDLIDELRDVPIHFRARIQSAYKLTKSLIPLRITIDRTEKIVDCSYVGCEHSLYEKYSVYCDFFNAPFCSVRCQLSRFIASIVTQKLEVDDITSKLIAFSRTTRYPVQMDYFDSDDPARLVDHFKIKSLIKSNHQKYLTERVKEKNVRNIYIAYMNHPLRFLFKPCGLKPHCYSLIIKISLPGEFFL